MKPGFNPTIYAFDVGALSEEIGRILASYPEGYWSVQAAITRAERRVNSIVRYVHQQVDKLTEDFKTKEEACEKVCVEFGNLAKALSNRCTALALNVAAKQPGDPIAQLPLANGALIEKFPNTLGEFMLLSDGEVNRIVAAYGICCKCDSFTVLAQHLALGAIVHAPDAPTIHHPFKTSECCSLIS